MFFSSVLVFLNCGSRNETPDTSGAAHFLEHLHFKGTSKRNREKLELDVENMGGQLNAYTSRENTSYTINAFKQNVPEALEILGDMLLNSTYENSYLMTERNTIYAELLETQKEQMEALVEHAHFNVRYILYI